MGETVTVRDVTDATFEDDVVRASHDRPVVVDFWAAWCGPCRQLSPMLEAAAARWAGDVDVVKVDVDQAPGLAGTYGVQGIPAVKAFRDGAVVAEFVGAQPQTVVERFFVALAPSQADRLVARARASAEPVERERLLRAALDADRGHHGATVALAGLLADRGAAEEARALLAAVPTTGEAASLAARLNLAKAAVDEADLDGLRAAADAGDARARLDLGRALAAAGVYEEALGHLVEAARRAPTREEARDAALEVFRLLGDDDERVRGFRPRLAAALF